MTIKRAVARLRHLQYLHNHHKCFLHSYGPKVIADAKEQLEILQEKVASLREELLLKYTSQESREIIEHVFQLDGD